MKIANSEVLKKREQELIGAVATDLDWEAIRQVLREKHGLNIGEDVNYRSAGIEAKENKILYSIDFDVSITLSIQLDRDGELVGVKSYRPEDAVKEKMERGGDRKSPGREISTSDIEMDAPEKYGLVERVEEEAVQDESEGGYEDVLMEFGSDSPIKQ